MTSFDGTVVSTVTECVEKTGSIDSSQDHTLRSQSTIVSAGMASGGQTTTSTNSQLRKLGSKDVLRQVMVQDIGWASQVIYVPRDFYHNSLYHLFFQ